MSYAELAVTTNFSFLRGASHPQDFVVQAQALGYAAIGIADRNTLAGVVRAYAAWKDLPEDDRPATADRGAAGVSRRHPRHPGLSQGPQGLCPAVAADFGGQAARQEG